MNPGQNPQQHQLNPQQLQQQQLNQLQQQHASIPQAVLPNRNMGVTLSPEQQKIMQQKMQTMNPQERQQYMNQLLRQQQQTQVMQQQALARQRQAQMQAQMQKQKQQQQQQQKPAPIISVPYKNPLEVKHHEGVKLSIQKSLQADISATLNPSTKEFENEDDKTARLLAWHCWQNAYVPELLETPKIPVEMIQQKVDGLYSAYVNLLQRDTVTQDLIYLPQIGKFLNETSK